MTGMITTASWTWRLSRDQDHRGRNPGYGPGMGFQGVSPRDGGERCRDKAHSRYTAASAVAGSPGLCLDNEDVRVHAQAFLEALADRYKDHPGMGAYNIWNEQNMNGGAGSCWCDASAEKFRSWLREKYKDLDELAKAWNRYSYRDWEDIEIPRHNSFYGDAIDWILFRIDNAYRLMKWRVETIRKADPEHPVTAMVSRSGCSEA